MNAKTLTHFSMILVLLLAVCTASPALAAPVCAKVKIEIAQELALERIAFDARLAITNSTPDQILETLSVNLQITDDQGADAGPLFFVKILSLNNIGNVAGSGVIPAQVTAEVHWMIIPSVGAGGVSQLGKKYFVGGEVNYTVAGAPQSMTLMPAMITVKPQPELVLDYFLPREVWADDPFTATVEAPIPFFLGVRTSNVGYGQATNLTINSGQPKIVENKQGLLIDFRLLGSSVNDRIVDPTLNLIMGNIAPQSCATGRWEMITTLSGKFIDFTASFTHASELGGTLTSVMKQVNAHFLTHEMLVDLPGSDAIHDFLAYDDPLGDRTPTTIYSSDCRELPVNPVQGTITGAPTAQHPAVTLTTTVITGWMYAKVLDPANGSLRILGVTRSDGKRINPLNAWISEEKPTGKQADPSAFYLNIVDSDTTGNYLFTYETPPLDSTPPVTTLVVGEPKFGTDTIHVTSATNFLFTATDDLSGVTSMIYRLDGGPETPGLPFTMKRIILPPATLEGAHQITYYSVDRAGNRETPRTATLMVDDTPPQINRFVATPTVITPAAPVSSSLPRQALLDAMATDSTGPLSVRFEVAAGSAVTDADFAGLPVIRTLTGTLTSGAASGTPWNGRNDAGNYVPAGIYTVRLTATDQLGQASTALATITVNEFLAVRTLSATAADQINPAISGTRVVWQDYRNSQWDIYLLDLADNSERNLTAGAAADQTNPGISGSYVVWQDRSSGNWDIVLYNLTTATSTVIAATSADETSPVVKGNWVAWQSGPSGAQDIYLYNIITRATTRITTDPRDQINSALGDTRLVWEDYRNGLGDIYAYDLITGVETRITDNVDNQTHPAIIGDTVVWVDQRHGNRDMYQYSFASGRATRLTYSATDEAQPYLAGNGVAFTDFAAGLADPNLALFNLNTRRTTRLISEPHRQEQPRLDGSRLIWQDNRSGVWQIYFSEVVLPDPATFYPAVAGFNLCAVTGPMATQYPTAFPLLSAWQGIMPVTGIESYDQPAGAMRKAEPVAGGAPSGTDFPVAENGALFVYTTGGAELNLGVVASCAPLTIKNGYNMVSFACLPDGFMATDLIRSLGSGSILSISRFDTVAARWNSVSVTGGLGAGQDFPIRPGEGYIIYATGDLPAWSP